LVVTIIDLDDAFDDLQAQLATAAAAAAAAAGGSASMKLTMIIRMEVVMMVI